MKNEISRGGAFVVLAAVAAVLIGTGTAHAADPAACAEKLVEGDRITVLVEGKGPDVVLIAGLSTPRAVWDVTAEALQGRYRLHRVQIRGFGDEPGINADGPVLEPVTREVADYIDDCITGIGRPAPAIVGHSMGGLTGLMIAARTPRSAGKLMIVDAVPFIGTFFDPAATAASMSMRAGEMAEMLRARHGRAWPAQPVGDPGADSPTGRMSRSAAGRIQVIEWTLASDARVTAQVFYDVMTTDMRGELAAVQAPVTLLYAQDDGAMPAAAAQAAFEPQYVGLRNFKAQMVLESRHFIMLDQPDSFIAAIEAFLAA